jgi:hypothetical protein
MKRALVALLLAACVSAPAIQRAPTTVRAVVVPETASALPEPPPAHKLSLNPSRIFAGQEPNTEHPEGTLLMVMSDEHVRRLDELDIATMHVFRSLDFGRSEFSAFEKRGAALYVVTVTTNPKVEATHTLLRVDLGSLTIVKSANVAGALPMLHTDHAFPPYVSVGARGVRVVYRGGCPESVPEGEERDAGCVYYETHRLADLRVVKVHMVPMVRTYSLSPERVPDDYGELPREPRIDGPPNCTTNGMLFIDSAWVGDEYFELRSGCCDEPGGGFFECKATK